MKPKCVWSDNDQTFRPSFRMSRFLFGCITW